MADDPRPPVARGFRGRGRDPEARRRVPPGQYETREFPVLSAGPTPRTPLERWSLELRDDEGRRLAGWSWAELQALPRHELTVDIHCVTKWTKLGTRWRGVAIDTLLAAVGGWPAAYVMAECDGGYTTNVPVADLVGGRAMVATEYDGHPLDPEHGGPARLLVPPLYFWKSAKWLRALRFMAEDRPGFWEQNGYHIYGDPWRQQRYKGD